MYEYGYGPLANDIVPEEPMHSEESLSQCYIVHLKPYIYRSLIKPRLLNAVSLNCSLAFVILTTLRVLV